VDEVSPKTVAEEELEEIPVEESPQPQPSPERKKWPDWGGRSSKVHLHVGRTLLRDFVLLDSTSECIDCARSGRHTTQHQFHVKASRLPRNKWYRHPKSGRMIRFAGPEAEHLSLLEDDGMLAGTAAAFRHDEEQRNVDLTRGISAESRCRTCRTVFDLDENGQLPRTCPSCGARNGLLELAQLNLADLEEIFRGTLPHEKALDIEKSQIRDEQKQIRESNKELVSGMTEAIVSGNQELLKTLIAALKGRESKSDTGAD
jgi:hypothetical protein